MCPAGAVVASLSLTQEVAETSPFTVNKYFLNTFRKISIVFTGVCQEFCPHRGGGVSQHALQGHMTSTI